MANNFKQNPMLLDTVISSSVAKSIGASSVPEGGWVLDEIYWYNPTSAGDLLTVTLGDGNTVIRQARCEAANQSQIFKMYGIHISDFQLTVLGSGSVFIYYH